VQFSTALLLALLLRAPWPDVTFPAILSGLTGFCGTIYSAIVVYHMSRQSVYRPTAEDWLHYTALPLTANLLLMCSAFAAISYTHVALFGVGAASLLLLFIGIRNCWDNVLYLVSHRDSRKQKK